MTRKPGKERESSTQNKFCRSTDLTNEASVESFFDYFGIWVTKTRKFVPSTPFRT